MQNTPEFKRFTGVNLRLAVAWIMATSRQPVALR
jgi:hypothetical protein